MSKSSNHIENSTFKKPIESSEKYTSESERRFWENLRKTYSYASIALLGENSLLPLGLAGSCAEMSFRAPQVAYLSEVLK